MFSKPVGPGLALRSFSVGGEIAHFEPCVGVLCSSLSYSASCWQAIQVGDPLSLSQSQVRHHAEHLARLRDSSEAIRMVPIENLAPPLPVEDPNGLRRPR